MEGFNKIDLDAPVAASKETKNNSVKKAKKRKFTRIVLVAIIILALVGVFSFLTIIDPARVVMEDIQKTSNQAKATIEAVKNQNIELASEDLDKTREDLKELEKDLQGLKILQFIPFANLYYNDSQHIVRAGFEALDAAEVLIKAVEPYADILGLKGEGKSFVSGTASERIETAVKTMGKITPHIDDIARHLLSAKEEIDQVDPSRYPSFIANGKIRKELEDIRKITDEGVTLVSNARPLIKILPSLLGEPSEKRYLVLFQNDKELRPTGGFITAYAIFRIDQGVIHVDRSSDIYNLDNTISGKPKAPAPILNYLPNVSVLHLRDSNLSPDFVESMKTFNSLYDKSSSKVEVDGVIALDTSVLVSTIKILDDEVYAGGVKFTTQEDKRCDCPQVIYELERLISTPKSVDLKVTTLKAVQAQRKDMIGVLLYAIMEKALKSSPGTYWGPLFQDFLKQVDQKHVMFYIYNTEAQEGIESLNAAGRLKEFEGDYLHVNEANFGGAKANLFIKESVKNEFEIAKDGLIKKTITIDYKNPYPPSDCNLERGNLCLNAVLRNWIRIYVPKGSKLIESKGSEVKMTAYEELGKTVFEGFLTVRPKGTATLTVSYELPFKVADATLPYLIQKQGGTDSNEYTIVVNGKETEKFPLLTDKEMRISL